ncbi:MAG: TonB-dependent receptor, partial [Asticcacaulis sp.]
MSGLEISLRHPVTSWLEVATNYTGLKMENLSHPATRITDIPSHKLTVEAVATPFDALEIVGFVEHNSKRWSSDTVRIDGFTTANLKVRYRVTEGLALEGGVNNLTDKNYQLADGFPAAGRTGFINLRYDF